MDGSIGCGDDHLHAWQPVEVGERDSGKERGPDRDRIAIHDAPVDVPGPELAVVPAADDLERSIPLEIPEGGPYMAEGALPGCGHVPGNGVPPAVTPNTPSWSVA